MSKDEDGIAIGKVVGPDVIGKALTAEMPRLFNLTFRIDVLAAKGNAPEKHVLYLGSHVDMGAGGATGLGNLRLPLDGKKFPMLKIDPADIVKALKLIEESRASATVNAEAEDETVMATWYTPSLLSLMQHGRLWV